MSTYNATTQTYTISEEYKDYLTSVFKSVMFYSIWMGASILMFFTFLLLSTKTQRRTCLFYLLSATFLMLLITAISALVKETQVRRDIFSKSLDVAKAAWQIRQSKSLPSYDRGVMG
jgi:predicted neutral ceramidase superfamily lipid hydrolase